MLIIFISHTDMHAFIWGGEGAICFLGELVRYVDHLYFTHRHACIYSGGGGGGA